MSRFRNSEAEAELLQTILPGRGMAGGEGGAEGRREEAGKGWMGNGFPCRLLETDFLNIPA